MCLSFAKREKLLSTGALSNELELKKNQKHCQLKDKRTKASYILDTHKGNLKLSIMVCLFHFNHKKALAILYCYIKVTYDNVNAPHLRGNLLSV